jgi:hypothetical protein
MKNFFGQLAQVGSTLEKLASMTAVDRSNKRYRSSLMLVNCISLCALTIGLCLPASFFALRAFMPIHFQEILYGYMLRYPIFGQLVSTTFFLVLGIGIPICGVAAVLDILILFVRGLPIWLKIITTIFLIAAIAGTVVVRHPTGP